MCQIGDRKLAYVIINSLQEVNRRRGNQSSTLFDLITFVCLFSHRSNTITSEIVQLTPADRRPFPFILADCIVFRLVGLYGIASWRLRGSTNGA
ncbi:hypothetical protein T12_5855 [Trichinella patagoniensis]|uniref:Uncharacterized protein n=1 Tax=Trichinella patagoniensis TaxID=990121 RepID=A0A0V1AGL6_9BILA|nr:hypothetical protein T06_8678 [Trichinella sp. T6]KRY23331.1 hypothetical protein T12_5855 [Trichinella patagoniensis]